MIPSEMIKQITEDTNEILQDNGAKINNKSFCKQVIIYHVMYEKQHIMLCGSNNTLCYI